ncbi:hypothetical protein BH09SUM1_BH09SUM1_13640 [soil metagenome]
MAETRHYFEIVASFEAADLFRILKNVCEDRSLAAVKPDFDFDWLKRRAEISASSLCGAEDALDLILSRILKKTGSAGLLLPGESITDESGRTRIPIGVLLQSPDIYAELIGASLTEFAVAGVRREFDGNGISIPVNRMTSLVDYGEIVRMFPLPSYLTIADHGAKESTKL